MLKGSVQKEDITIVTIYVLYKSTKYVKQIQTELKEEIECSAFILGDFNTPLERTDPPDRKQVRTQRH